MDWIAIGFGKALTGWNWWLRLVEVVAAPLGAAVVVAIGGAWVAVIQRRSEAMKLRHTIAERRVKGFDEASSDLRRTTLEMLNDDGSTGVSENAERHFCNRYPDAGFEVLFASHLAMLPEYYAAMKPVIQGFLRSCDEVYESLTTEEAQQSAPSDDPPAPSDEGEQGGTALPKLVYTLQLLMEAVDVSAEARLEGRPSRRHNARIRAIAKRLPCMKL